MRASCRNSGFDSRYVRAQIRNGRCLAEALSFHSSHHASASARLIARRQTFVLQGPPETAPANPEKEE